MLVASIEEPGGTVARWGITVPFAGSGLDRDLIAELPSLGYTDAWSAEVNGSDGFTPLALAAEWAPELRLGTAIVPVSTRGPGLLAMTAATVADRAPGRFLLGIGASSPAIVERWNAGEFVKPYARTRDTLRFLRKALNGEKVSETYETFSVRGFKLEQAPKTPPRIVLAALRPRMFAPGRRGGRRGDHQLAVAGGRAEESGRDPRRHRADRAAVRHRQRGRRQGPGHQAAHDRRII